MARIVSTIADPIGGTPLICINHVTSDGVDVAAKVEVFNPASSVKGRIARSIVDTTEASSALAPDGTTVEATFGNMGIALSMVGATRGYEAVIVMSASMSVEHRTIVCALGAELVLTNPKSGAPAAAVEARRIASERPGTTIASQFTNPANPATYAAHTGKGIWADTNGQVDVFAAGVGTGGVISGVAEVPKKKNPNVCIIIVQPTKSPLLTGGTPDPHDVQGLIPDLMLEVSNADIVDEVISVEIARALEFVRHAVAEGGLLMGIFSDAALAGTVAVATRPELISRKIVTLLPDTGERCLSTALFTGPGD